MECQGTTMFKLWTKLKSIKKGLKYLHHKEFSRLDERIESIREELRVVQNQLAFNYLDNDLHNAERDLVLQLKKFLGIQEIA